jgi:phenylacetate-coenzyme A ligase PaaK-like adenylate-forming protein
MFSTSYEQLRQQHVKDFAARLPEELKHLDWTSDELRSERERRLRILIKTAKERSPWHRERLADIDPERLHDEDLVSLPTMTKADLMANWDAIVTDRRVTLEKVEEHLAGLTTDAYLLDHFHAVASSGSTGPRGVFVYDWEGWLVTMLGGSRYSLKAAATSGDVAKPIVAGVGAERPTHISSAVGQTFSNPSLPIHHVPVTWPIERIISRLNELQPTHLSGYASMLHILAEHARDGLLQIHPRRVLSNAEPLLPEARQALQEVWGVPVTNGYGASEGWIALGCPLGGGHVVDDLIYFEPVNEAGGPVPVGLTSDKVYVTNLYNLAMPLIRYEITDQVMWLDQPCDCPWPHRRIGDVQGRLDDVFAYGDIRVHPHVFRSPISRHKAVTAYQVQQTPQGAAISVQLIGDLRREDLERELENALAKIGLADPTVTVAPVEAIGRGATGKLKRFVPLGGRVTVG